MSIESDVFERSRFDRKRSLEYGFKEENNKLVYSTYFLENQFQTIVQIDKKGNISGKVIEVEFEEEYNNIRIDSFRGEFVARVKEEYIKILEDIKKNCCIETPFITGQANRIANYIQDTYQVTPEFLWEKYTGYGIFRNNKNNKWFSIIMQRSSNDKQYEIMNVKVNPEDLETLLQEPGFYVAYHMDKKHWVTILLDETLSDERVKQLVDTSFQLVDVKTNWIIPSNPQYFDVISYFEKEEEIIWKQSSDVCVDDIIYMYVAKPYSCILYKCQAIEVNIPYEFKSENVSMKKVMRLKLLKKYKENEISFDKLKSLGIKFIRGPRKISDEMVEKITE